MALVSIRGLSFALMLCFCTWHLSWSQNNTLTVTPTTDQERTCELVDGDAVPWCAEIGYNWTSVPNFRNHPSQQEAFAEMQDFDELLATRCSGALLDLLCSFYVPPCFDIQELENVIFLPPCKNLCLEVRNSCLPWFIYSGDPWPEHLDCDMLQEFGDGTCYSVPDPSTLQLPANIPAVSCTPQIPPDAVGITGAATMGFSTLCVQQTSTTVSMATSFSIATTDSTATIASTVTIASTATTASTDTSSATATIVLTAGVSSTIPQVPVTSPGMPAPSRVPPVVLLEPNSAHSLRACSFLLPLLALTLLSLTFIM